MPIICHHTILVFIAHTLKLMNIIFFLETQSIPTLYIPFAVYKYEIYGQFANIRVEANHSKSARNIEIW